MENNYKKYFLPLNDIPFEKIPSLEGFSFKFVQCEELRLDDFYQEYASIIWIKDIFHENSTESYIDSKKLLFGAVYSQYLSTRGKVKCIIKKKETKTITLEILPHLKFETDSGNSFVIKNGKYAAMYGEKVQKERVSHLEGIHIYADWLLKLRVVIELLKKNVKTGLITLSLDEYKKIAHLVLRNEPTMAKCSEDVFEDAVNNWIPTMIEMPLIEDIPEKYIGKMFN